MEGPGSPAHASWGASNSITPLAPCGSGAAEVTKQRHVLSRDDEASAKHDGQHVTRGASWVHPFPSPSVRGGRRPVGCFGRWIYCGDVFFFLFRHRKRNRRTRGWWRPNCERWMNIPRIGLMNIPTTFRKSWDGHSPQKWRDFITLVFIQDLVWLLPGLELRDWLVQSAILVEFPCNCHELIWIVLHTTSYICWSKKASWTANSCWIQDMQKMTQMAANMDPSVMEPR